MNLRKTIRTLVQHLPNLVELELSLTSSKDAKFAECVRSLSQLKFLKVVKLHLNCRSAIVPLESVVTANILPITHFKLIDGKIAEKTIKIISHMKRLKVLELHNIGGLTDEHIIQLAKGLSIRLEKLQLEKCTAENLYTDGLKKMLPFAPKLSLLTLKPGVIVIDAYDYQEMLKTIQKRPEKNSLLIELTGDGGQVKVLETILMKNRNRFYIDEKICEDSDFDDDDSSDNVVDDDDEIMEF